MISVDLHKHLPQGVGKMARRLSGEARREMLRAAGLHVQELTSEHVRKLAGSRHETARRLGARPTNYFAQAAEKVAASDALSGVVGSPGNSEITLSINHAGFARAFRDVQIKPRAAQWLTIPVHTLAYGRRAGELQGELDTFVLRQRAGGKSAGIIAMKGQGGFVIPLYVLVKNVSLKQDRSLLPSEDALNSAAARGAQLFIKQELKLGGNV